MNKVEKNKYFLSCDLGSEYIKLILFESIDKNIKPIKHFIKKVDESDLNNNYPERCISNSLTNAITEMELPPLDDLFVNINNEKIISKTYKNSNVFSRPIIVTNEILETLNDLDLNEIHKNEELVYLRTNKYIVDNKMEVNNPLQMEVNSIQIENFYIKINEKYLDYIDELFSNTNLKPTSIIPGIVAQSEVLLSKQDKNLGSTLIDVGYSTTDVLIYSNGNICNCFTINVGIGDFIEAIGNFLNLKYKDAYYIYKENADLLKIDSNTPISYINIYGAKKIITVSFFNRILEDLIKQLFTDIKNNFEYNHIKSHNIVLCGGLSKIKGIKNLASKIFNMNRVKIAKIDYSKAPELNDINWATCLGMIKISQTQEIIEKNNNILNIIYKIKTFIENILK